VFVVIVGLWDREGSAMSSGAVEQSGSVRVPALRTGPSGRSSRGTLIVARSAGRALRRGSIPSSRSCRWAKARSRALTIPISGKGPTLILEGRPFHLKRNNQRLRPVGPILSTSPATAASDRSWVLPVAGMADNPAVVNQIVGAENGIVYTLLWTLCGHLAPRYPAPRCIPMRQPTPQAEPA
jgi:hypothetical protein